MFEAIEKIEFVSEHITVLLASTLQLPYQLLETMQHGL